jgi:hypothetical protein
LVGQGRRTHSGCGALFNSDLDDGSDATPAVSVRSKGNALRKTRIRDNKHKRSVPHFLKEQVMNPNLIDGNPVGLSTTKEVL